ncbi:U6 snRNA-associated Sm-like protein LSm5 [Kluyveromyces marxianus]|uniref:LSM complex subunit LSM5 n=2 Tax=Kluyveromyces marxianus TaxID=4911 RepID=W0T601_KLUMD|nr:U6 snRNA-associated Sm-like protein LSm5 [Kluyveromyces marxianus DMKU3-1042]KAG0675834.1 RNA-binding protein lsm5 [Kluyveromyces marxianus]QGN14221.1 U6 snRNA-associated Sm-like protein LSm5 [Kluyveromyces marxianus]BAO38483.1 U6 snRNA-associated Sm-like protein LSm5 [Kluyveromyces marxianus DMKU3-1042]
MATVSEILPLEVIDKTIGQEVSILLKDYREFLGTLVGFDDYVNVVLENAVEYVNDKEIKRFQGKMLLTGNNIAMLIPGGKPGLSKQEST